jgi:hypothetical protein
MLAGGLIPRMTTKRFPRHGVTVQNGRELIALSAVKPLEASLRDGSQIGVDVRGLKPTANINRPSGTGDPPIPYLQPSRPIRGGGIQGIAPNGTKLSAISEKPDCGGSPCPGIARGDDGTPPGRGGA